MRLGLVQMACGDDPGANLRKAVEQIGEAAGQGAHIVCLQELFRSRYFCQREDAALFDLAEPIPGPSTEALSARRGGARGGGRRLALRAARGRASTTTPRW